MSIETKIESYQPPVKLPEGLLTLSEAEPTPAQYLTEAIDRFEAGYLKWQEHNPWTEVTSRKSRSWGECNVVPDFFSFVAQDEARRKGYDIEVRIYQLMDLQEAAGAKRSESFQHGFNTVTIGDESFLVDLSFSQFNADDGYLRHGPVWPGVTRETSGTKTDNALARAITEHGFVPLTDGNLQEYLRITSTAADKEQSKNLSVADLKGIRPLPMDLVNREIEQDFGLQQTAA